MNTFKKVLIQTVTGILFALLFYQHSYAMTIPLPNAKNAQKIVYGKSGNGRDLSAYKLGSGSKNLIAVFEVHGFEDAWDRDGMELVKIGNYLIEHLDSYDLNNWTVIVIPSANPDGLIDGWTNNGPGRCTITTKIDINRSFPVGFKSLTTPRNNTGEASLLSSEAKALHDFISSSKSSESVLLDIHGWEGSTIGNSEIGKYFNNEFKTKHKASYGAGYLTSWGNSIGMKSTLVELPFPSSSKSIESNNYAGKIFKAVANIIKAGQESPKPVPELEKQAPAQVPDKQETPEVKPPQPVENTPGSSETINTAPQVDIDSPENDNNAYDESTDDNQESSPQCQQPMSFWEKVWYSFKALGQSAADAFNSLVKSLFRSKI